LVAHRHGGHTRRRFSGPAGTHRTTPGPSASGTRR
jgi:hypothetical protein